jgi:bacillithiol system protein YtxJ
VQAHADLSKRVAERTGVAHESPQALWIRKGRVGWHASHLDVTVEALTRALIALPAEKKGA